MFLVQGPQLVSILFLLFAFILSLLLCFTSDIGAEASGHVLYLLCLDLLVIFNVVWVVRHLTLLIFRNLGPLRVHARLGSRQLPWLFPKLLLQIAFTQNLLCCIPDLAFILD